jgi:16S rRNA (cytosine1402-N4)-methyltransferase
MNVHTPVMVAQVVEQLVVDPGGMYLDATAGGGGHGAAILAALDPSGRLLSLDRDAAAVAATRTRLAPFGDRARTEQADFASMTARCQACGVASVNGVLFDLGVSSYQLDTPERGFSFRAAGPLDMRMDESQECTAATWLRAAGEDEIARALREFGEERGARRIARSIVRSRAEGNLQTTADLRTAVAVTRPASQTKTLARVFQAVRIVVNDELAQLERGLDAACSLLEPGGRLVLLNYQSGEDRVVKRKLAALERGCVCPPRAPLCTCGRRPSFRRVLRRPLRPSAAEVAANSRARSARLRAYEKLGRAGDGQD